MSFELVYLIKNVTSDLIELWGVFSSLALGEEIFWFLNDKIPQGNFQLFMAKDLTVSQQFRELGVPIPKPASSFKEWEVQLLVLKSFYGEKCLAEEETNCN